VPDIAKWDHCEFQKDQWGSKGASTRRRMTRPRRPGAEDLARDHRLTSPAGFT
jgi:hypothetical protein